MKNCVLIVRVVAIGMFWGGSGYSQSPTVNEKKLAAARCQAWKSTYHEIWPAYSTWEKEEIKKLREKYKLSQDEADAYAGFFIPDVGVATKRICWEGDGHPYKENKDIPPDCILARAAAQEWADIRTQQRDQDCSVATGSKKKK